MLESNLNTYLTDKLDGITVYAARPPQRDKGPSVVYHVASCEPLYHLQGYSGVTRSKVQFDCWANDQATALAYGEALRLVLSGYRGMVGSVEVLSCVIDNMFDLPERVDDGKDTWRYRRVVIFSITYRETVPVFE